MSHVAPRPLRRLLAPASLTLALAAAAPALATEPRVIASGLDNPRGLDVAPNGSLYIAEAGRGGPGPCAPGPEGEVCAGRTGAVTRVERDGDGQRRVATGLASIAARDGSNATGPHDVAFDYGRNHGWLVTGLGADPAARAGLGEPGPFLGWLYKLSTGGTATPFADLAAYEAAANPDAGQPGSVPDSNPWSVVSRSQGAVVSDAGGNDLVAVSATGTPRTLAVFPDRPFPAPPPPDGPGGVIPADTVPTGLIRASFDEYWVGQLTGFPFPEGGAQLYSVARNGGAPEVRRTGFTHMIDLARGRGGTLYVLQIFSASLLSGPSPGKLIAIAPDGSRRELVPGQLTAPTGLTYGPDRALYVSDQGLAPGQGRVWRIPVG